MIYALILAAGNSSRMKMNTKKQFIKINNKPLFVYSIERLLKIKCIDKIYINFSVNDKNKNEIRKFLKDYNRLINSNKIIVLYKGGKERYDTVYNALDYIYINNIITKDDKILIHDSARPVFNIEDTKLLIKNLDKKAAITLATKSIDTLKKIYNKSTSKDSKIKLINYTLDRNEIYNIKTPQGFKFLKLYNLYKKFVNKKIKNITDDIMIIEKYSKDKAYIIETDNFNYKVTNKSDIDIIKLFLKK